MKLAIYDFDNVLSLKKAYPSRRREYEEKLVPYLNKLRKTGVKLCIVSTNGEVVKESTEMAICHLFDHVLSEESYSKVKMLKMILNLYPEIEKTDVVFFDDDYDNIADGEKLGIKCFCIAPLTGIADVNE